MVQRTVLRSIVAAAVCAAAVGAAPAPARIVFCAPGYPGNTAEAQPAMDGFAEALAKRAGPVRAVYHESEGAGLAAIREDAALAVVPLPFFVKHAETLGLAPILQAVPAGTGATETWTLVAKTGRVSATSDLAGWEIVSIAGYSAGFVRNVALGGWGPLPGDVRVTPSALVLSALRKAAQGANVAVLLDGSQGAALAALPFAKELAVVHRSKPLPVSVVARVGSGTSPERVASLSRGMRELGGEAEGAAALAGLRMTRFVEADGAALAAARAAASR